MRSLTEGCDIRADRAPLRETEECTSGGICLEPNRLGDDIPAYRVVNARGILSGAAAFETADMQKMLLENEGVEVRFTPEGWQVDLKKDGWHNTMEEALRFQEMFEAQDI